MVHPFSFVLSAVSLGITIPKAKNWRYFQLHSYEVVLGKYQPFVQESLLYGMHWNQSKDREARQFN